MKNKRLFKGRVRGVRGVKGVRGVRGGMQNAKLVFRFPFSVNPSPISYLLTPIS
jgi:hypothetical protein